MLYTRTTNSWSLLISLPPIKREKLDICSNNFVPLQRWQTKEKLDPKKRPNWYYFNVLLP